MTVRALQLAAVVLPVLMLMSRHMWEVRHSVDSLTPSYRVDSMVDSADTFYITSDTPVPDGRSLMLYTCRWLPSDLSQVKGVLFIAHGYGEHCERFGEIAGRMVEADVAVYAIDHQGHGKSDGERVYVEDFDHYVDDMWLMISTALHDDLPEQVRLAGASLDVDALPHFLLGNSMGGLIAVHTALRDQSFWNGVILSGPALSITPEKDNDMMRRMAHFLSVAAPKLWVAFARLDRSLMCTNETEIELYEKDPLCHHGGVNSRWGSEFVDAVDKAKELAPTVEVPLLIVHGAEDKICLLDGSEYLLEQAKSTDKQMITYPKMFHGIWQEIGREKLLDDVVNFVRERL